jgi:nitrate/nitrite transport system ATP-binding protein
MSILELKGACKWYGDNHHRTEVLEDVNLAIREGEFVAIVGFSGSGKSTLINLLTGLLTPNKGEALMRGKPITGPGPDRGVVFQNYSLLPWMTAFQNVKLAVDSAFPSWSKQQRREHIEKYLKMVSLDHAMHKRPGELSGGMRQRVSVARALAMSPEVLLLDEPLGALDALTRGVLQGEIARIWEQEKKTVVLITNDVDEAILLADRIFPLRPGPRATLGPEFNVSLARPRERKALNHCEEFKHIRNAVTRYLMEASAAQKKAAAVPREIKLPDLQPADLRGLATA